MNRGLCRWSGLREDASVRAADFTARLHCAMLFFRASKYHKNKRGRDDFMHASTSESILAFNLKNLLMSFDYIYSCPPEATLQGYLAHQNPPPVGPYGSPMPRGLRWSWGGGCFL